MAQNLRQGVPWVAGVIIERLSPLTYLRVTGDKPVSEDTQPQDSEWNFAESPEQPPLPETSRGPDAPTTSSVTRPVNRRYPQ